MMKNVRIKMLTRKNEVVYFEVEETRVREFCLDLFENHDASVIDVIRESECDD